MNVSSDSIVYIEKVNFEFQTSNLERAFKSPFILQMQAALPIYPWLSRNSDY